MDFAHYIFNAFDEQDLLLVCNCLLSDCDEFMNFPTDWVFLIQGFIFFGEVFENFRMQDELIFMVKGIDELLLQYFSLYFKRIFQFENFINF